MDHWHSLALGDGMMANLPSDEIRAEFARLKSFAKLSSAAAVFTRHESEGRLHCEVIAYFSPAAGEIAKAFHAAPCERPQRSGLSLLAGDEEVWEMLFKGG